MYCEKKFWNLLTICRKANKLVFGFALSKEAVMNGRAYCLLIASDVSDKTKKESRYYCDMAGIYIDILPFTIQEMSVELGRKAGVIAVCDEGFAKSLRRIRDDNAHDKTNIK